MEYFDFIHPGEAENLPENRELAFARFVELAQPRLAEKLAKIDSREVGAYDEAREARYGFHNVVMGAARKFGIEPFASAEMALIKNYSEEDYKQFRADLSLYITQIMLHAADRERNETVPLREKTRQSLLTYMFHLREAIENSRLPDWEKARLHERTNELEKEFTRPRVRIGIIAAIVMAILAAPGQMADSYDAIARLTNSIMREIGDAKAAHDEQRQISREKPVALLPPRRKIIEKRGFERAQLDDEIPF